MLVERALAALRTRVARPFVHRMRRPYVLRAIARASEVRLLGHRIRTDPGVFHPLYFSSSRILAAHLLTLDVRGLRVLDMGTGTGLIAVVAAARGARVTACDINSRAVALATENSARNAVATEVLESDLFEGLAGARFDLICFNIPFYAKTPRTPLEAAYYAGPNLETVHRFAKTCVRHLEPGGRVVIVYSEDCDPCRIRLAFTDQGLALAETRTTRRLFEDFFVDSYRSTQDASEPRGGRC
jgi:release factor glutamine methyltransferase